MKKCTCLIMLIGITFLLLTGCGKQNHQKSEDEIKAEIKAEIEAEQQKEAEMREKIKEELLEEENHVDSRNEESVVLPEVKEDAESQTTQGMVNVQDLKKGSTFDGYIIKTVNYRPDDEFTLEMDGEITFRGYLFYDDYFGSISFACSEDTDFSTQIKLENDHVIDLSGGFTIRNQDILMDLFGEELINKLKQNTSYKLDAAILVKNYMFGAKLSEFYMDSAADLVAVIDSYEVLEEDEYFEDDEDIQDDEDSETSVENDLAGGYTYRVENGILKLTYINTGNEINIVESRPASNDDNTTYIADFTNIQKSHDGTKLFFEVIGDTFTNFIHVVDLYTLEERFFTYGWFIQNVAEEPYMDVVVVKQTYIPGGGARIASYFAVDYDGNTLCELGETLDSENLVEQITKALNVQ